MWNNLPMPEEYDDKTYRSWLLNCFGVEESCADLDRALVRQADKLYGTIGQNFSRPLEQLKRSESFAPYLLLYGNNPSDADVFTMLLSYDLFPFFARCVNEFSANGVISAEALTALTEQCSL